MVSNDGNGAAVVSSGNIFEQKEKILSPLFDKLMVFDWAWSLRKK